MIQYKTPKKGDNVNDLSNMKSEEKEVKQELTQAQKIRAKIKELRELEAIEKKIAKTKSDLQKLKDKKSELEQKYNL